MGKDLLSLFILASFAYLAFSSASRQEASSFNRAISTPRHLEDDPAPASTADTTNPPADGTPEDHTAQADHTDHAEAEEHGGHEHTVFSPDQPEFWGCLGMAVLLCLGAGVFSGLTVGYLSIDQLGLELKMKNGTDKEKSDAIVIMPILAKHHLLISTLLLGNALVMESLPLFLDAIMPAAAAIIVSTSAVVLFGEIIPQAYCTGPKQIQIAVTMAPVIKFFIFIFYPICYPISLALDAILGLHQKTRFVKKDLKALVELHELSKSGAPKSQNWGHGEGHEINADAKLTKEEVKVINSTIDLRDTPVTKEMEKIEKVFMLSNTAKIDQDMLKRISRSGFSKVPVYKDRDKNNILGFIRVKTLLDMDRYEGTTIENSGLALNPPLIVAKDTSMLEMLILFQEKKTSVALVSDESVKDKGGNAFLFSRKNWATEESKARLIGLVSLKDLFEEILESKMGDEDVHGAVTLQSARDDKLKKRFGGAGGKSPLGEIKEAVERPEKGMARSPYGN